MRQIKKYYLIIILCLTTSLASGCWSRREIGDLAIVGGMAIDVTKKNGKTKYQVILNILQPSQLGGGQTSAGMGGKGGTAETAKATWQMMGEGDTIYDAIKDVSFRSPRSLFFSHMRYVIFSEEVAREGLHKILDFFNRYREIRLRTYLLMGKGSIKEIIKTFPELEPTHAEELEKIAEITLMENSRFLMTDIKRFTENMIEPGIDPVVGLVEIVDESPDLGSKQTIKTMTFKGGAAFRGDKLAGLLNEDEMRGYLIAIGKANGGIFPINMGQDESMVSVELTKKVSSNLKVEVEENRLKVKISILAFGELGEHQSLNKIATSEQMQKLDDIFSKTISNEVRATVKKAQEYKTDIFGIGQALERSDPQTWKKIKKDWPEYFSQSQVTIDVQAHVQRNGLISDTPVPDTSIPEQ